MTMSPELFCFLALAVAAGVFALIIFLAILAIIIRGLIWFFPAMISFFKDMVTF